MIGRKLMRRLSGDRNGLAAVEFAMMLPLLCVMLGGVVDFGRFLWFQTEVTQALRSGMQYAMANPTSLPEIQTVIQASTALSPSSNFSVSTPTKSCACSDGSTPPTSCSGTTCTSGALLQNNLTLTATYTYTPLLGTMHGLLPSSVSDTLVLRTQ